MKPFEGAEKKCAIVVNSQQDLRSYPVLFWKQLVARCSAEILSSIHNAHCDAFLLSESSLFVWSDRLLLITCGQTKLVHSITHFLKLFQPTEIQHFLFQRKNEFFSHLQPSSFQQDIALLQQQINGDSAFLGTLDGHHIQLFYQNSSPSIHDSSPTYELLMYGMSNLLREILTGPSQALGEIRSFLQLSEMLPGFLLDDHLFEPFGYSLNAINQKHYLTIHISPEQEGAYASVETNLNRPDLMVRFLSIFRPDSFDVVMCNPTKVNLLGKEIQNRYDLQQEQRHCLENGDEIHFLHYQQQTKASILLKSVST